MIANIDWNGLAAAIAEAEQGGTILGVSVIAPSGERFDHNADRRFIAASTVKVPIMIALFRRIDEGSSMLAERYRLRPEDRAPGSGVMLHLHDGMEFTLADLVYLMIAISDNTATNILIDIAGMQAINTIMRELGMSGSTLRRKMQGHAARAADGENWATPGDYARVIAALLNNEAASAESCATMIAMLEKQQNDRRIARHLPRADRPRWGSKTGSIEDVTNDVGFVMTRRGPLILSLFCHKPPDPHAGEAIIGAVSSAACEAVA
ncbi:MAG TPA: serine hydrolase [Acetobacteraceae bacterium]|nr:serine hydrolase [Acetobacteraceae bacterium]